MKEGKNDRKRVSERKNERKRINEGRISHKVNNISLPPLSKLYCLERISDQYCDDSVLSFLGFSSLFTDNASMFLLNSASGIFLSVS